MSFMLLFGPSFLEFRGPASVSCKKPPRYLPEKKFLCVPASHLSLSAALTLFRNDFAQDGVRSTEPPFSDSIEGAWRRSTWKMRMF